MDNAIMLIVVIVLIMTSIAVLTTKQQEAVEEGFMGWGLKDSRVKQFLGDYKYNKKVNYPGMTGNYANYCRTYANLDACRWSPAFRNGYCRNECQEGKSMNCYRGNRYEKKFPMGSCTHKSMDNRRRIDRCKSVLATSVFRKLDTNKLEGSFRQSALNPGLKMLNNKTRACKLGA